MFGSFKWWNSPYINHFLSADTIGPSFANPQSLNRYSYVLNNPLKYTDPTGHKETACSSQRDIECSGVNGAATGNTHGGGGNGNGRNKNRHGNDEGGVILGPSNNQSEDFNWFQELMRDKNTPIVMAAVQEVAAGIGEIAIIATVFQPELVGVSAVVFGASWVVGRVASAAGTAATTIQYKENLNSTNQTDVIVSWGTTLAGLNPEWSAVSSTANLIYTAERTAGWAGW